MMNSWGESSIFFPAVTLALIRCLDTLILQGTTTPTAPQRGISLLAEIFFFVSHKKMP